MNDYNYGKAPSSSIDVGRAALRIALTANRAEVSDEGAAAACRY